MNNDNQVYECSFCGTEVKQGLKVCKGCGAEVVYGATPTEQTVIRIGITLLAFWVLAHWNILPRVVNFLGYDWETLISSHLGTSSQPLMLLLTNILVALLIGVIGCAWIADKILNKVRFVRTSQHIK